MSIWIAGKDLMKHHCHLNTELNLEDISDKDYLHSQKVWDIFEIRNLGEYHDLYVQTNTALLADFFEKFRKCVLKNINLILLISYLHLD